MISEYFHRIRQILLRFSHITSDYNLIEKIFSSEKGYISGSIEFINSSVLEFAEVKSMEISEKVKYRYHYMDKENQLIFRYDNTKHFPLLSSFPHHKHIPNDTLPANEPDFENVLFEIEKYIINGIEL